MDSKDYSALFDEIVVKVLTAADLNSSKGHQHEFNGVAKLKHWFSGQKIDIKTKFVQLDSYGTMIWSDDSVLTWYNAREKKLGREEFRMYYHKSIIFSHFNPNDLMVIVFKLASGIPEALMISVPFGTPASNNIAFLLKIRKTTNLPPIMIESNADNKTIGNVISLLDDFANGRRQSEKHAIKKRSASIRETVDLSDVNTNPDKCLEKLFIAERQNDSDTSGYYEQLAWIMIRNGVFFDYVRDHETISCLNLGTFGNKKYRLYTCLDDCLGMMADAGDVNYCVIMNEESKNLDDLENKSVIPIVISGDKAGNCPSLRDLINEIKSIQGS